MTYRRSRPASHRTVTLRLIVMLTPAAALTVSSEGGEFSSSSLLICDEPSSCSAAARPSPYDRILATRFGVAAVDLIAEGGFGKMVCLQNGRIEAVEIAQAIGQLKKWIHKGSWCRPPALSEFVLAIKTFSVYHVQSSDFLPSVLSGNFASCPTCHPDAERSEAEGSMYSASVRNHNRASQIFSKYVRGNLPSCPLPPILTSVRCGFQLYCCILLLIASWACSRGPTVKEIGYISAPQAFLRDQVAAVYSKTGTVKNGDKVEVLGRDRRFAKVRTSPGAEGWIEQRFLASKQTYDAFQKLEKQEHNDPAQSIGTTRNQTNIHLEPGRDTDHLYQLDQAAKVSILKRATIEKVLPGGSAKSTVDKTGDTKSAPMEDWWLIRDQQGHTGWILSRMVDVDVPLEIAQYAEGQRIVATFVLDEVKDAEKNVPQYLVLLTENKDGMPFDYDQIRVFTWNLRRHRYETAYRERNLDGVLPVTVSQETLEKEGVLPVFVLRVKDESGNTLKRKYKLDTPLVKRVYAPGEQPSAARRQSSARRTRR